MKCYIITCAVCGDLDEVSRKGMLTCSTRCPGHLKRNPEVLEELRGLCELVPGCTPFILVQAYAWNLLTDRAGVRLTDDLSDRFWTGDINEQERSAWAAAVSQTSNGSQHEP